MHLKSTKPSPDLIAIPALLISCAIYGAPFLFRSWFPWDEGTLALTAEQVSRGLWPHIGYDEPYTGGLSLLNAFVFSFVPPSFDALRLPFFLFAGLAMVSLYLIFRHWFSLITSFVLALLAWVSSVPNYPAPMPSWYNLFFAIFIVHGLLRYQANRSMVAIVVTGVLISLSVLAKISGLYMLASTMLFFYFDSLTRSHNVQDDNSHRLSAGFQILIGLSVSSGFFALFSRGFLSQEFAFFVLPVFLLVTVQITMIWTGRYVLDVRRFLQTAGLLITGLLPFALLFAVPYVLDGEVGTLYEGIFVRPSVRLQSVVYPLPNYLMLVFSIPIFLALLPTRFLGGWLSTISRLYLVLVVVAFLVTKTNYLYELLWVSLRSLPLAMAAVLVVLVVRRDDWFERNRSTIFLVTFAAYFVSLVQFPYSHGVYFLYAVPLVFLAAALFLSHPYGRRPKINALMALAVFILAVLSAKTSSMSTFGREYTTQKEWYLADTPRGRVLLPGITAGQHIENLVQHINNQGFNNSVICLPDCPHIYFLANSVNQLPWLFEVLNADPAQSRPAWIDNVSDVIDRKGINVFVLNRSPSHTFRLHTDLLKMLREYQFGNALEFGPFLVLSRDV